MKIIRIVCLCASVVYGPGLSGQSLAQTRDVTTPPELVQAYETLADTILGAKNTEKNLVHAILATTYAHAEGTLARIKARMAEGKNVRGEIEELASYISQLGNEGDSAVAGVRKRLLEGGHHHNAKGEAQGIYDEGFVIVTRAAKKSFLNAATETGKLSRSPNVDALDRIWTRVETEYARLVEGLGK